MPVNIISLVKYLPITFEIIVPPKLGNKPNLISGKPNLAPFVAIIILQNKANSKPPPKARLLTQAIIGLLKLENVYRIKSNGSYKLFSIYDLFLNELISTPALKAFLHKLSIITTLISIIYLIKFNTVHNSNIKPGDNAFNVFGKFNDIIAIYPSYLYLIN